MGLDGLKNRIKNMVWTVADDYGLSVDTSTDASKTDTKSVSITSPEVLLKSGFTEEQVENEVLYASAHESGHVKHSSIKALMASLKEASARGYDVNKYKNILNIVEDYYVDNRIIKERAGFEDMRRASAKATFEKVAKPREDSEVNTLMAMSLATYGLDLRDYPKWETLVDWDKIATAKSMAYKCLEDITEKDRMNIAFDIYDTLFGTPEPPEIGEGGGEGKGSPDGSDGDGTEPDDGEGDKGKGDADGESSDSEGKSSKGKKPNKDSSKHEDKETSDTDRDMDKDSDSPGEEEESDSGCDDSEESDEMEDGESEGSDSEPDVDKTGSAGLTKGKVGTEEAKKDGHTDKELRDMAGSMMDSKLLTELASKDVIDDLKRTARELSKVLLDEEVYRERMEAKRNWCIRQFGKPISEETDKRVTKQYGKGMHSGSNNLWTKGAIRGGGALKTSELGHKNYNMSYYNIRKRSNTQQIAQLAEIVRNAMRAAYDPEGYTANNGAIVAGQVWRTKCNDGGIFHKEDWQEEGGFAVQIVMDASGSQRGREQSIAIQTFILTEALTKIGIPTQVVSFTSYGVTNIMTLYRDYDDPMSENENVFEYYAKEENRDGFALQVAADNLMQRKEAHKIMIVLQDGAPSDGCSGDSSMTDVYRKFGGDSYYSGERANRECSKVIRNIRQKGIALMGIFTREGASASSLNIEKLIFGNDFAYIKEPKDFARIAGNYIVKQIKSITD